MSKKQFPASIENAVYKRMTNVFPGCNATYTAHKCVVNVVSAYVDEPTEYEYCVGRADKTFNPDPEHVSETFTFTLYPTSYVPKVFQITDQQGFHWIEYQVWAAAAKKIDEVIRAQATDHIIPVLINTGDMTQNGTRVNEWLDYYNGGKCLFSHLEQMNVVGNNDLCGSEDEAALGTGDDEGKSNGYYFHVFYCYDIELDENQVPVDLNPIINGKYVPSLYEFKAIGNTSGGQPAKDIMFLMVNSELTPATCKTWYGLVSDEKTVNAYTGWEMKKNSSDESVLKFKRDFTPIYSMLYKALQNATTGGKQTRIIAACHEMPFTVITTDNIPKSQTDEMLYRSRSLDNKNNLVGCHMNQMSHLDVKSNNWFSRLLEHFNVKLCIGGHKHTYACTRPIRELYQYEDGDVTKSSLDGKMTMPESLSSDSAVFMPLNIAKNESGQYVISSDLGTFKIDGSKFPLIPAISDTEHSGVTNGLHVLKNDKEEITKVFPFYICPGTTIANEGVSYFMLQATGYKQTSNKELPSPDQAFSFIIPKTEGKDANVDQKYPMFAEITIGNDSVSVMLERIHGIMKVSGTKSEFSQQTYSPMSEAISIQYLKPSGLYGEWQTSEATALTRQF